MGGKGVLKWGQQGTVNNHSESSIKIVSLKKKIVVISSPLLECQPRSQQDVSTYQNHCCTLPSIELKPGQSSIINILDIAMSKE